MSASHSPSRHSFTRRQWLRIAGATGIGMLGVTPRLSAAGASRYRGRVLSKKPVGYWRLGEATGPTARDESGNSRHGTFHGTPTVHQPGALKRDEDTAITLKTAEPTPSPGRCSPIRFGIGARTRRRATSATTSPVIARASW